jgi:hypothetical protein
VVRELARCASVWSTTSMTSTVTPSRKTASPWCAPERGAPPRGSRLGSEGTP